VPKNISQSELDVVAHAVAAARAGASIDALLITLNNDISRRTLQRRLTQLVDAGRVEITGAGRATRYRMCVPEAARDANFVAEPSGEYGGVANETSIALSRRVRRFARWCVARGSSVGLWDIR